jgi:NAD(P)-dependent dehydrogenase (short-subunit alcohol dehydrogenase family)
MAALRERLDVLMKRVALELARHGITVNTFALGSIQTDINAVN